jgi:hypothetical protein
MKAREMKKGKKKNQRERGCECVERDDFPLSDRYLFVMWESQPKAS